MNTDIPLCKSSHLHRALISYNTIVLHLPADDAIALFQRCKDGLKSDGIIFVKENICSAAQNFAVDKVCGKCLYVSPV